MGSLLNLILPELLPVASMAFTILSDWSSATSPKTTCLPSSQPVTMVVMKNWDPLLEGKRDEVQYIVIWLVDWEK